MLKIRHNTNQNFKAMECSKCKIPLQAETIEFENIQFELEKCPQCESLWFDHFELLKAEKYTGFSLQKLKKFTPVVPDHNSENELLFCPSCTNHPTFRKMEYVGNSPLIIDYCPMCQGIWLEKETLFPILEGNVVIPLENIRNWFTLN